MRGLKVKIGTLLFTYNRPHHTKQVIKALAKNTILPDKLYVFQDGLKQKEHRKDWQEVKNIIRQINFCNTEIIEASNNNGLAKSVVDGINYVFQSNESIIVLEDDCVPAPSFMNFMYQALEKYQDIRKVYNINGYGEKMEIRKNKYDAYFLGRASSWGWGTWKDRWLKYSQDNEILNRLMADAHSSLKLSRWGRDLPDMMEDRINGRNDSWAVYWALIVIENNGLCLRPYESLVKNIGFDASGVHCGSYKPYDDCINDTYIEKFKLPDEISISEDVIQAFANLYGSSLGTNDIQSGKDKVIVYGVGSFFHQYENHLEKNYNVIALCDKIKSGYYAGIEIITPDKLKNYKTYKIIIMIKDIIQAQSVLKQMRIECDIPLQNIILGTDLYS